MGYVIACSGAHGTGKTTSAYQAAVDLKLAHPDKSIKAVCDLEVGCPYLINKESSEESQSWIFLNQAVQDLTYIQQFDIVVTDHTLVDIAAYTYILGFHDLAMSMVAYTERHLSVYKKIYFKRSKHNLYYYDDGIREVQDITFREDVDHKINDLYNMFLVSGYLPEKVFHV